jgi:hypothetical protein
VTDFAKLFCICLYLDIAGGLKDMLLIIELLNQRTEHSFVYFNNQLFEIIAEMDLALTNNALLPIEYFDHLIDRL